MNASRNAASLKISEIFYSLQGESLRVGLPTVFVRLTGCPLRCRWCDTEHAFSGGRRLSLARILEEVARFGVPTVCVTGGEPLAQSGCIALLGALCDAGFDVSLETSGALDISGVDARVCRVVDLKAPGSGESEKNYWPNIARLTSRDELKFVLADRADYEWACQILQEYALVPRCPILFSPAQSLLPPRQLAEWILADRLPVRFQLQLHKCLWGNMRGR